MEGSRDGLTAGGGGMEGVDDCGLVGGGPAHRGGIRGPPHLEHTPSSYQASPRPKTTPSGRRAFGGGVIPQQRGSK